MGIGSFSPIGKLDIGGSLPNGEVFSSATERNQKTLVLNAGNIINGSGYRMFKFFDFPQSNIDSKPLFLFALEDRNDFGRYRMIAATGGYTQMQVLNKSQQEIFNLYEDGNDNVYFYLPKLNSRMVIGDHGYNYLPEHKFVVRGSSKIEGNILTDANIGIGTSNFTDGTDTYRLSVKGKVRAEEIKVYNTWADYVFSPRYNLPSLKQVENYITRNGHLPNVPSAKEITEKGLELGEMAKIQQEKIEELTLYLIQQNKEIEELKAQVKLLLAAKK